MKFTFLLSACLLVAMISLDLGSQSPSKRCSSFGHLGSKCYDADAPTPMETPNIDALAKKGGPSSGRHPAAAQKNVVGGNPPTPYNKTAHPVMDPWYNRKHDCRSPKGKRIRLRSFGEMAYGD